MKIKYSIPIFILALSLLFGCMGGGTHGSIKRYEFQVPKSELEKVVQNIIQKQPNINRKDEKGYYNDDSTYVTIKIIKENEINEYVFHYYGNKEYWKNSMVSSISISYAHNKEGQGGSSGNGGVKWYNFKLKKELTSLFEEGFINKIDKELNTKHVEFN